MKRQYPSQLETSPRKRPRETNPYTQNLVARSLPSFLSSSNINVQRSDKNTYIGPLTASIEESQKSFSSATREVSQFDAIPFLLQFYYALDSFVQSHPQIVVNMLDKDIDTKGELVQFYRNIVYTTLSQGNLSNTQRIRDLSFSLSMRLIIFGCSERYSTFVKRVAKTMNVESEIVQTFQEVQAIERNLSKNTYLIACFCPSSKLYALQHHYTLKRGRSGKTKPTDIIYFDVEQSRGNRSLIDTPLWDRVGMEKLENPRNAIQLQNMLQKYKNMSIIGAHQSYYK